MLIFIYLSSHYTTGLSGRGDQGRSVSGSGGVADCDPNRTPRGCRVRIVTRLIASSLPQALELDAQLASVDGFFVSYPVLAGRLIV